VAAAIAWQLLTTLSDVPSATVLACALESDRVDVRLVSDANVLGQAAPCRIYVDGAQLHRARWAMAQRSFSEEELAMLSSSAAEPSVEVTR
jgi:hypothetical protein